MLELIAIAVDGTPAGHGAVSLAANMTARLGARALVLCTIDMAYRLPTPSGHISIEDEIEYPAPAREQHTAETIIALAVDELRAQGLEAEGRILVGTPSRAIVESAKEAGAALIVMGHRHLSWFDRLLHPSICWDVLEHAHCPVLVSTADAVR